MYFISWQTLATYSGSLAMVLVITQFTKELKFVKKLPTQVWSYIITLAILYPAYLFTGVLSAENAMLILFNAVLVALAANGGFDVLNRVIPKLIKKT